VTDERFTPEYILPEMDRHGYRENFLNRALIKFAAIDRMRSRTLLLRQRFLSFLDREPPTGPGRVDTFNPPKVLLGFPMQKLPKKEWVGNCDLPSIWNQRQREGMQLHWDGNNTSVEERNRSAAFGTGARPAILDRAAMKRTADWLRDKAKPAPFPSERIDAALAQKGRPLYERYCAECHGRSGTDFAGKYVGKVTDIALIGTDHHRLDSYTRELSANQNLLYAGYPEERFKHFRKTNGYANQPLDGIWLRAPYLHNGSVPTLRDLLEPHPLRPPKFFRGYDVYDFARVGFISNLPSENGRSFFSYDTAAPGNGNAGHEDPADGSSPLPAPLRYGTNLPADEKDAIVEYLKTF
jgi:mono/diheme cytochrome c family protein